MAPKKKKTKEEIEEERRIREEEARLAEEERLRQEEEERRRQEEEERQRKELLAQLRAAQDERIAAEQQDLAPWIARSNARCRKAAEADEQQSSWQRYLACSTLPLPGDRRAMSAYLHLLQQVQPAALAATLLECEDQLRLARDCDGAVMAALQDGKAELAAQLLGDITQLHRHIGKCVDSAAAATLQHAEQQASEPGGNALLEARSAGLACGIWANLARNPRMRLVELPALQWEVTLPTQVAISSLAVRLQYIDWDPFHHSCRNQFMAVGGVFCLDLLNMPQGARKAGSWTVYQMTQQWGQVSQQVYPLVSHGEEEVPPLGLRLTLQHEPRVAEHGEPRVGWWDQAGSCWREDGITDVVYEGGSRRLSFNTRVVGHLAVIRPRQQLLPLQAWDVRPSGGEGGNKAVVTLHAGSLDEPLLIEVGPGTATLQQPAGLAFAALAGRAMPVLELLLQLQQLVGLALVPTDADVAAAGLVAKDVHMERAMCADVALASASFLVASSRWNQQLGSGGCCMRISEVEDWEEGGRTAAHHLQRILQREQLTGTTRVLATIHLAGNGISFSPAKDKEEVYQPLPATSTLEEAKAAAVSPFSEVHASLFCLLKGTQAGSDEQKSYLKASEVALQRMQGADAVFVQSLAQLLQALRPFSCC